MSDRIPGFYASDLLPWDEIILSGKASSPEGLVLENVTATVATIDRDGSFVKIWPTGNFRELAGGKIWLRMVDISALELVYRDTEPS